MLRSANWNPCSLVTFPTDTSKTVQNTRTQRIKVAFYVFVGPTSEGQVELGAVNNEEGVSTRKETRTQAFSPFLKGRKKETRKEAF